MMARPIVIELTGVTCSGKTTLYPVILSLLRRSDPNCAEGSRIINELVQGGVNAYFRPFSGFRRQPRIHLIKRLLILGFFFKDVPLTLHWIAAGCVLKYGRSFKCFRSYLVKLGFHQLIRKVAIKGSVIIDEGIVHTVQSIFVAHSHSARSNPLLKKDLATYICNIPLPDVLIVIVNRNKPELYKRLIERGHHRLGPAVSRSGYLFVENAIYVENLTLELLSIYRPEVKVVKIEHAHHLEERIPV